MRIFKFFCVAFASLALMAGCSKSDNGGNNNNNNNNNQDGKGTVVGQWHLVSWSNLTAADVYLSFTETGAFEIYQRVYSPEYVHYDGTYAYDNGVLSGIYSDSKSWASNYNVSFNADGTQMKLTSVTSSDDVSVYEQATIPDEILSGELTSTPQSRAGEEPFRFL